MEKNWIQVYLLGVDTLFRPGEEERRGTFGDAPALPEGAGITAQNDFGERRVSPADDGAKRAENSPAESMPGWDRLTGWQQEKVSRCKQNMAGYLCLGGQLLLQYAANTLSSGRPGRKPGREDRTEQEQEDGTGQVQEDRTEQDSRTGQEQDSRTGQAQEQEGTIRLQKLTGQQLLAGIPAPLPLEIGCGLQGKPYIVNAAWHFNLSHSGKYVALALSNAPVGIDIQRMGPYRASLAKRFFAAEEAEACERLVSPNMPGRKETAKTSDGAAAELFCTLWCRKEAYGKLKGTGLTEDVLKRNMLKDVGVHLQEYRKLPNYCICVCSEEEHYRDEEAACIFEGL